MDGSQSLALGEYAAEYQQAGADGGGQVHFDADHGFQQHAGDGAQDEDDCQLFLRSGQLAGGVLLLNVVREGGVVDVGHEPVADEHHVDQGNDQDRDSGNGEVPDGEGGGGPGFDHHVAPGHVAGALSQEGHGGGDVGDGHSGEEHFASAGADLVGDAHQQWDHNAAVAVALVRQARKPATREEMRISILGLLL